MGILGILVALGLLIWLAYRGWSILLLAPAAAVLAAGLAGEPLLAHWTQTFMGSAARFIMQFFPIFLLGALFGKLMKDSGSVSTIASFMTECLGAKRAVLAVVLAGALVTYGGVSLFVAFFVIAPMAHALFRSAEIPRRLMPAAIMLGASTFTMSALPGTPASRTPSRCRFSVPRPSRRQALDSSPRSSCWGSAYGGSPAPRPKPAARAKVMEQRRLPRVMPRRI